VTELSPHLQHELTLRERAMSASSCGITIADANAPDMPLVYVNESFARISGYAVTEMQGRNCRFLQGDDRDQDGVHTIRAALAAHAGCTVLLRNYRKDGGRFWNELIISPVFSDAGLLTHYIGIQTDVTARVEAENALRETLDRLRETQTLLVHSEKMNALGQMVAGIAHEVNNPVSFVNSNLHSLRGTLADLFAAYNALEALALDPADAAERARITAVRVQSDLDFLTDDLDDMLSASIDGMGRVRRIVETLRTFSRLDEAAFKVTDLEPDLASTLLIAQNILGSKITVAVELADDLVPIACFPAELNQAFLNIIINAGQAMPDGGTLTIRAWQDATHTHIAFTDTGHGMTPDVQARIFNPFFTTKPVGQGTGLGLTIAYKVITDRHKGVLEVRSAVGSGTTFTVHLPKDLRP
jgi:PAS domain S-box-containing protein